MPDSPLSLPYDNTGGSFAPTTGKAGQAVLGTQGGQFLLGSDYAASPAGQLLKIDASGSLATSPANTTAAGTTFASAGAVKGVVQEAMQGLTAQAVQMDSQGQVSAAPIALPTFTAYASPVTTANGKSMLALMNKSTSSVVRLLAVYAQNSAVGPQTLTSYYIYVQQLAWITGLSGGTAVTPAAHDTADALPNGITLASAGTVSGESTPALRRWVTSNYPLATGGTTAENTTGDEQGRFPWHYRFDPTAKPITIRPGNGVHLKVASTADNGAQNVTFVFTVSGA